MKTSFVQIEPENKNDLRTLYKLSKDWPESYASSICLTANRLKKGFAAVKNSKIYVSTIQQSNFNELKNDEVLGLLEVEQVAPRHAFIHHIQVEPSSVFSFVPYWKGVGSGMLDSLKKLNDIITLRPNSEGSRIFYGKNGFVKDESHPNRMIWRKK